jgi:hypothetical protein
MQFEQHCSNCRQARVYDKRNWIAAENSPVNIQLVSMHTLCGSTYHTVDKVNFYVKICDFPRIYGHSPRFGIIPATRMSTATECILMSLNGSHMASCMQVTYFHVCKCTFITFMIKYSCTLTYIRVIKSCPALVHVCQLHPWPKRVNAAVREFKSWPYASSGTNVELGA